MEKIMMMIMTMIDRDNDKRKYSDYCDHSSSCSCFYPQVHAKAQALGPGGLSV